MKKSLLFLTLFAFFLTAVCPAYAAETNIAPSLFSARDLSGEYDDPIEITLLGGTAQCISPDVNIDGSTVILTAAGTYRLTGALNGQILVDAEKTDKLQLILDGAEITSSDSAAIHVQKADKVFLTLASDSQLASGASSAINSTDANAAVYSKSALTINGSGSLKVTASAGSGIVCKDSLRITGGTLQITAGEHGISGKELVAITNTSIQVNSGSDGIRANRAKEDQGTLCITSGSFRINSAGDGIYASGALQIDGGDFSIATGGGSENASMKPSDAETMGRGFFFGNEPQAVEEDTASAKGIKSNTGIQIAGGSFQLDCADDAVHADGDVTISGGSWLIRSADDAIHSGAALHILDGSFTIPYCYEGLEGQSVTVDGGNFEITSTDDGINAAGGADSSGFRGGFGGGDPNAFIEINSGTFTIVSDGDCIDSNNTITINGGSLNLTCAGNGNSAIDAETTFTHNGGDITTNDGSENGGGRGSFGGMGGRGDFGGRGQRGPGGWDQRAEEMPRQIPGQMPKDPQNPPQGMQPGAMVNR